MTDRLKGKRIIITGAVDNIGKAAVRAFLNEGARAVIGDIDAARGRSVAEEFGPAVRFLAVDVTDDDLRPFACETVRVGAPDALSRAGDDHDLALVTSRNRCGHQCTSDGRTERFSAADR